MIELIAHKTEPIQPKTLKMCDMKPLQVCVVVDGATFHVGTVVMRTAYVDKFEVMDLTSPRRDNCWDKYSTLLVRELYPGETYTLKLS